MLDSLHFRTRREAKKFLKRNPVHDSNCTEKAWQPEKSCTETSISIKKDQREKKKIERK